jgi:integrase
MPSDKQLYRILHILHSILRRSITRARARDKVKRNVVLLCDVPQGQQGRPSKSLTYDQAAGLLAAAEGRSLHAYIVVSLLTGARTEELQALTWSHVQLDATPPVIMVWSSVRAGGDTKTRKSRRTLELPQRAAEALRLHRDRQDQLRKRAGDRWHDNDLVFASRIGTALWAGNVRRSFRAVLTAAGLDLADCTPRELRHSFVSLMSDAGVPIERIARLVGHTGTTTTETIYPQGVCQVNGSVARSVVTVGSLIRGGCGDGEGRSRRVRTSAV